MAELVVFQPNEYDNNKLLYPALAFSLLCSFRLYLYPAGKAGREEKLYRRGRRFSLAALCSVSAVLTMGRGGIPVMNCTVQGAVGLGGIYWRGQIPADAHMVAH